MPANGVYEQKAKYGHLYSEMDGASARNTELDATSKPVELDSAPVEDISKSR
jgi:hypothetical protein